MTIEMQQAISFLLFYWIMKSEYDVFLVYIVRKYITECLTEDKCENVI